MYTDKVIPIIKEVGRELAGYFDKVEILNQKGGSPYSVVTELDLKTEKYLAESLKKAYPSIEFFGEEFGGNDKAERHWLVDPIDGTAHFLRGMPFCTVMLALVESGEIVFSVIHNIATGETFCAEKGQGAKKDGKRIHVSDRPLASAYMTFEMNLDKKEVLDIFLDLRKRCILFNTINCGFEFSMIACGKIEGNIAFYPFGGDYDYAPGTFLVKEAGGAVFNIGKDSYDYKDHNFIAANPVVFKELREIYKNL